MPNLENKQHILIDGTEHFEDGNYTDNESIFKENSKLSERRHRICWGSFIVLFIMHLFALYGIYLGSTKAKLATLLLSVFSYQYGAFGICGGAHRLWAHRAYKATWQLKCILIFGQTLAYQNSAIHWIREHRTHHKYTDTDADPHNSTRGFFFSHIGWLVCKKLDDVKEKGKTIDLSDLYEDPILRWQHQYFWYVMPVICYLIPTVIPMILWNETFENAFFVNAARHILLVHGISLVNSAAHIWGSKPYDQYIRPVNNPIVSFFALGEGWHNYHHAFPWDYRASEFGNVNTTLKLINFFAKIGWAYDLKTVSKEMIKNKVDRSGDGSHEIWGEARRTTL